jgi:hypothetical protein
MNRVKETTSQFLIREFNPFMDVSKEALESDTSIFQSMIKHFTRGGIYGALTSLMVSGEIKNEYIIAGSIIDISQYISQRVLNSLNA